MAFSLDVLDEEKVEQEVEQETKVKSEEAQKLHKQAAANVRAIMDGDIDSLKDKKQFTTSIEQFGMDTMEKSAQKNALLKVSVGQLAQSGEEGGEVSKGLMSLNKEIKSLDPSGVDFAKRGVFGRVLNPIKSYFEKYEKSEDVINGIMDSLDQGKNTLKNDNTTLAIEQLSLRNLSKKLNKEIEMAVTMDKLLVEQIEEAKVNNLDPDKIRFVEEEILFPLRQRTMDMQQMVVVNQQGIIAMEVIQRNNKELMRGVDRAKTVTITALRTAIMVASALYNQKLVLQKIKVLNETTNNMIATTSRMLKEQGTEIHKQAIESNISVDVLKGAFEDVMEALDEISSFKQQALPVMQTTIEQFRDLADKGEVAIQNIEKGNALYDSMNEVKRIK